MKAEGDPGVHKFFPSGYLKITCNFPHSWEIKFVFLKYHSGFLLCQDHYVSMHMDALDNANLI